MALAAKGRHLVDFRKKEWGSNAIWNTDAKAGSQSADNFQRRIAGAVCDSGQALSVLVEQLIF